MVDRDAPVLLGEHRHLLPPAQMVATGAVQEQHGRLVTAGVFVVETKAVLLHERHRAASSPPTGPATDGPRDLTALGPRASLQHSSQPRDRSSRRRSTYDSSATQQA